MRIHQSAAAGRAGPANHAAARPGLTAPRSLGAPGRAFRPHPPNCCRLAPLPLPGTWKPRAREPIPAEDAGLAAAGSQGGGGRGGGRRRRRRRPLLLCTKDPLSPPSLPRGRGAGATRAGGKADGVWKNDTHTLDAAAATLEPQRPAQQRRCPGLLGRLPRAGAGVTRAPWLRSAAADGTPVSRANEPQAGPAVAFLLSSLQVRRSFLVVVPFQNAARN